MTIYLCVKTHTTTGLKYLCQTTNINPHKYRGSGKYWKLHLKKHGYEHNTKIIKECSSNSELKEWGLYYSNLWNVVASNDWANLKPEEGEGAASGKYNHMKLSEQRKKTSLRMLALGENHFNKSPEQKAKRIGVKRPNHSKNMTGKNNPMYGKKRDKTKGNLGMKWYTDGTIALMAIECPDGFVSGRLPK
jgi:hypothetical protein